LTDRSARILIVNDEEQNADLLEVNLSDEHPTLDQTLPQL
jgi:hypothetical protein